MHVAADIATCMYRTGIDPFTKQEIYIARGLRDRKMQRALMQFFKPENWFTVREALIQAERQGLIGNGCDCLIPANPPKEALEARRRAADRAVRGDEDNDHHHTVVNPANGEKPGERGACPRSRRATGRAGSRRSGSRERGGDPARRLSHASTALAEVSGAPSVRVRKPARRQWVGSGEQADGR
jgi:hypothetical protein